MRNVLEARTGVEKIGIPNIKVYITSVRYSYLFTPVPVRGTIHISMLACQIINKVTATVEIKPSSTAPFLITVLTQNLTFIKLNQVLKLSLNLTLTQTVLIKALITACGKCSNISIYAQFNFFKSSHLCALECLSS
jgi:hypothetical protein